VVTTIAPAFPRLPKPTSNVLLNKPLGAIVDPVDAGSSERVR
jgi:hypothetical protein